MIDFQGREIRQPVKWDRIPIYCQECKHVGHSSEVCYANGKGERPKRREYKRPVDQDVGEDGGSGLGGPVGNASKEVAGGSSSGVERGEGLVQGGVEEQESGDFLQQGRRRGKQGKGFRDPKGGSSGEGGQGGGFGDGGGGSRVGAAGTAVVSGHSAFSLWPGRQEGSQGSVRDQAGGDFGGSGHASGNRFSVLSSLSLVSEDLSFGQRAREAKTKIQYLKMLPNGDFDAEVYEDEKDWDDEEDGENETMPQLEPLVEKRGADLELEKTVEQHNLKKGKLSEGAALVTSSHVV